MTLRTSSRTTSSRCIGTGTTDRASNYLMRAAGNVARDYLRARQRRCDTAEMPEKTVAGGFMTAEEAYVVTERAGFYETRVRAAMDRLPVEQRDALQAYCSDENLAREARRSGVSYSTLRSRMQAGLSRLRRDLGPDCQPYASSFRED